MIGGGVLQEMRQLAILSLWGECSMSLHRPRWSGIYCICGPSLTELLLWHMTVMFLPGYLYYPLSLSSTLCTLTFASVYSYLSTGYS